MDSDGAWLSNALVSEGSPAFMEGLNDALLGGKYVGLVDEATSSAGPVSPEIEGAFVLLGPVVPQGIFPHDEGAIVAEGPESAGKKREGDSLGMAVFGEKSLVGLSDGVGVSASSLDTASPEPEGA